MKKQKNLNERNFLCYIRYVNPGKLLQSYHGATTQHELFQVKTRDWQLRIDSLGTELPA